MVKPKIQRLFRRIRLILAVLIIGLSMGLFAFLPDKTATAAPSSNLNFQARLSTSAGSVVPDGYYNVQFKIYNVDSGGSALWTETRYDQNGATGGLDYRLRVVNGYMTVSLGDTTTGGTAFPAINWDQEHWITMNIGGSTQTATPTWDGEMNPRLKLTAVPYAFQAGQIAKTDGSGNRGTLSFNTVANNPNIIIPDVASGTLCLQGASACGFAASAATAFYLQQVPTSNTTNAVGANVITPTANSVVGLTVNGTSGTAATAVDIIQGGNATALNVSGSGTGSLAVLNTTNSSANGVAITTQSGSSSQYGLSVVTNNGGTPINALYVRADGNVGIGTASPSSRLQVEQTSSAFANASLFINNDSTTAGGYGLVVDNANTTTTGTAIRVVGVAGANVRGLEFSGITTGTNVLLSTTTGTGINANSLTTGAALTNTGLTTSTAAQGAIILGGGSTTTGTGILFNPTNNAITSAKALSITPTASAITADYTGAWINVAPSRTMTAAATRNDTGNLLNLSPAYAITGASAANYTISGATGLINRTANINNASSTFAYTGAALDIQSSITCTAGTCSDSSNLLKLNQQYGSATGALLSITGAGTGNLAVLDATNASANGVSIDVQSSSSSQYALNVTANNGATNALYVRADGNVGIGTAAPAARLDISAGTTRGLRITNSNSTPYSLIINNSTFGSTDATGFGFWQGDSGTANIDVNGVRRISIRADGNVGIGATNPLSSLHVVSVAPAADGAGNGAAGTNGLTVVAGTGQGTSGTTGQTAGTGGVLSLTAGTGGAAPAGSINGTGGSISLQGGAPGAGAGTAGSYGNLLLNSSGGNVGIGNATPSNLLTVNQAGNTTAATTTTYGVALYNQGTVNLTLGSDATNGYLQTWSSKTLHINNQGNNVYIGAGALSPTAARLVVLGQTNDNTTNALNITNSTATSLLMVRSDGSVGIGTTTFGTSATGVLALGQATAPSTSPADNVQLYVTDAGAGDARLRVRMEGGGVVTFPNETGTICTTGSVCTGYAAAAVTGSYLQQIPATTAANTVTPTVNGVVGLTVNGTSGTAATAVDIIQGGNAVGLSVASAAITSSNVVNLTATNAAQTTSSILNVVQSGTTTGYTGNVVNFTGSSTTGAANLLNLTSVNTTAGNALNVTANGLTTGNAVNINSTSTGVTTGSLLTINTGTTGAVATNGIVSLNATGNYTSTSNVGLLGVSANATTTGTVAKFSGTALTTGQILNLASGTALTTGGALSLTGASYLHTTAETGSLASLSVTDASTATSGTTTTNGLNISLIDNAANNTAGASIMNGINLNSTINTSGATATKSINVINIATPTKTACIGGACTWTGINVADPGTLANTTFYAATFLGGNVGIGTATPSATLHVSASGNSGALFRVTDTTATTRDVINIADGGATTLRNQTDSTAAFQVQSAAAGTAVMTVDTTNSQLIVRGTNSDATLGSEKVTNGTFTGNATGWNLGTGWAYNSNNVVKTAGTASVLDQNVSAVNAETYQVSFTISGWTAGCLTPIIGGKTGEAICANSTMQTQVLTATGTGNLQLSANIAFAGTVDNVSVVNVTPANSVLSLQNSAGVTSLEVRTSSVATNTFIGLNSGRFNTTGVANTATGYNALQSNTTGLANTATGSSALASNTTGVNNVATGYAALQFNTTGINNTANGYAALQSNTIGTGNTANGSAALKLNTTGINNTATGYNALQSNTIGIGNIALGYQAGETGTSGNANTTGSFNTFIGYSAGPGTTTQLQNAAAIGAYAVVSANDSLVLGCTAGTNGCTTSTKVGIGIANPTTALLSVNSSGANISIDNPTDGQGLILAGIGNGVTGQLRIVANNNGWADGQHTAYFQIKNSTNNNVTFMGGTYGSDNPFDRLQFASYYTSFTDGNYSSTPVPSSLLELINTTAAKGVLRVRGATSQSGDYLNIDSVGGSGGNIFTVESTGEVGIGTSNPGHPLQVESSTNASPLRLVSTASGNTGSIRFQLGAQTDVENTLLSFSSDESTSKDFTIAGLALGNITNFRAKADNSFFSGNVSATGTYNTNTFTSSALTFGAASAAAIQSAAAQDLTVDSGTTGGLNIATGGNAKTVTLGNTTGATGIVINTGTNGVNIGDNANTKTTDIGGNDANGADTVRIATNATSADTITIGSTHVSSVATFNGGGYNLNIRNTGVGINATVPTTGTVDLFFGSGARTINVNQSGASTAGGNLTMAAGMSGTGAVNGGNLILQGGATGGSGTTGSVIVKANGTNSATAFQIQQSDSTALLTADTTTGAPIIKIGTTGSATIGTSARLFTTVAEVSATIRIGDGTNGVSFNDAATGAASKLRRYGTARESTTVTLIPEFAGAVLTGDGTNNTGTMTSDFCSGTSRRNINNTVCAATQEHNYYSWTAQATNDYDVYVRYQLPSDYDGIVSDVVNANGWRSTATESAEVAIFNAAGNQCGSGTNGTNVATGTAAWSTVALAGINGDADCNTTNMAAGSTIIIRVRLTVGTNNSFARIGAITFDYYSKF